MGKVLVNEDIKWGGFKSLIKCFMEEIEYILVHEKKVLKGKINEYLNMIFDYLMRGLNSSIWKNTS